MCRRAPGTAARRGSRRSPSPPARTRGPGRSARSPVRRWRDRVGAPGAGEALAARDVVKDVSRYVGCVSSERPVRGRPPPRTRRPRRGGLSGAQSSSRSPGTPAPGAAPIATIVVPGSPANAVRLTPGRANTNVPAGASTSFTVELEPRPAAAGRRTAPRVLVRLVVLVDDPVAGLAARPGRSAERRDPEVVPHGAPRLSPVGHLVDLVQSHDPVTAHRRVPFQRKGAAPAAPFGVCESRDPTAWADCREDDSRRRVVRRVVVERRARDGRRIADVTVVALRDDRDRDLAGRKRCDRSEVASCRRSGERAARVEDGDTILAVDRQGSVTTTFRASPGPLLITVIV